MTFCSTHSSLSGPMASRASAVCSGVVKYGCAPSAAVADSSSIFGPSAASRRSGFSAGGVAMYIEASIAAR